MLRGDKANAIRITRLGGIDGSGANLVSQWVYGFLTEFDGSHESLKRAASRGYAKMEIAANARWRGPREGGIVHIAREFAIFTLVSKDMMDAFLMLFADSAEKVQGRAPVIGQGRPKTETEPWPDPGVAAVYRFLEGFLDGAAGESG